MHLYRPKPLGFDTNDTLQSSVKQLNKHCISRTFGGCMATNGGFFYFWDGCIMRCLLVLENRVSKLYNLVSFESDTFI